MTASPCFSAARKLYAARQSACPGCYYYTPGWNRARRVPGPDRLAALREDFSKQFDPEDVEFLLENERAMWESYDTATFIGLGTPEAGARGGLYRNNARIGWAGNSNI